MFPAYHCCRCVCVCSCFSWHYHGVQMHVPCVPRIIIMYPALSKPSLITQLLVVIPSPSLIEVLLLRSSCAALKPIPCYSPQNALRSSISFSQTTRLCVSTPQNALRLATVTIIITIIINFAVLLLPSHKPPASVFLPHRTPCVWPPSPSSSLSSSTSLFFYLLLTNYPHLCFYPTERPASGHRHHHHHYHHQLCCSSISFSQTTRLCVSTPHRTPCVWPPSPSSSLSSSTLLFFYNLLTNHPPL